ncbi:MAG: aminotransferase class I/II-fold pyridoxal phosphate-dependent enzyme [Lachnospiraceae bacterium]|nr:aminotransferase class I/II-fold pyridoxal phosphate-dependent enzyme [Lachnospiraceae bacterium]
MGRLREELLQYTASDYYPFHMPGHKRNEALAAEFFPEALAGWYGVDITEIDGFDNMHHAEGLLKESMQELAEYYGSDETRYLVNGSSSGVLIAISAAVKQGGSLLMMRSSHQSAYHAVELRGIKASYLYGEWQEEFPYGQTVSLAGLKDALAKNPETEAVFLTSPSYEGYSLQLREIADYLHEKGIPLIVDAAHGAHFGTDGRLPESAVQAGADLVIQSLHKTMPAPTMAALLHCNYGRIKQEKVQRFYNIYQTSSPSYPMMMAMESCVELYKKQGKQLWDSFFEMRKKLSEDLKELENIGVCDFFAGENHPEPGKLLLYLKNRNDGGKLLEKLLLEKYHLQAEMATPAYVLLILTPFDTEEGYRRLSAALREMDGMPELRCGKIRQEEMSELRCGKIRKEEMTELCCEETEGAGKPELYSGNAPKNLPKTLPRKVMEITKAREENHRLIRVEEAEGKTAGEYITVYPPGQPLLVPGEVLEKEHIELLLAYGKNGFSLQGVETDEKGQMRIKITENKNI